MTIRAAIVDDEGLARERVREMLSGEPDVEVVAECDGGEPAVHAIRRERPDLVFLDVQMPEVDGFDVLRRVGGDRVPAVVFVTAYEEHAMRAFEVHALDYLLKPFREERFRSAMERVRRQILGRRRSDPAVRRLLASLDREPVAPERLVVRSPGRISFVPVDEIDWVESAGNYVLIHVGPKSHLLRQTMTELERQLSSRRFVRIHRSTIVRLERVREVFTTSAGDARAVLDRGKELTVSRRYRKRLEEMLAD